jgi:hypothetical protein
MAVPVELTWCGLKGGAYLSIKLLDSNDVGKRPLYGYELLHRIILGGS